jgi:hypothetical protein
VIGSLFSNLAVKWSRLKYYDGLHRSTIRAVMGLSSRDKAARGIERTVRLYGNFPGLWQRTIEQTPGGSCQWGKTLFVADGEADHAVILNALHRDEAGQALDAPKLGKGNIWVLHMEPDEYISKLGYDRGIEHEIASLIYTNSPQLLARNGPYVPSPPYVHFNLGRSWDFLSTTPIPTKTVSVGIISSDLAHIAGHLERLKFLEALDASGIESVLWGRGAGLKRFRNYRGFLQNKWQGHAASRYSIVIENSVSPLYWSEKVADALLAYSLPLYHGCPNLGHYLPADSFIPIDIRQPQEIDRIRTLVAGDEFERRMPAIAAARDALLRHENVYAFIDRELDRRT